MQDRVKSGDTGRADDVDARFTLSCHSSAPARMTNMLEESLPDRARGGQPSPHTSLLRGWVKEVKGEERVKSQYFWFSFHTFLNKQQHFGKLTWM